MPVVTKDQALKLLTSEVQQKLGADELLEVFQEVFPNDASTEERTHEEMAPLIEKLVDHVNSGLEMDQLLDLWGLIFPRHRNVWYDDEEERLHYNEEAEASLSE